MSVVPVWPPIAEPLRLHWLPLADEDVKTKGPLALHKVVGPLAEIVGVTGVGLTVTTVAAEVALQLNSFVTVTV